VTDQALIDIAHAQIAMARNLLKTADVALISAERILNMEAKSTPPSAPAASPSREESATPVNAVLPEECDHPKQYRMNAKVMGAPNRMLCTACGATFDA
jgi:hypothetical protein